MNPATKFIMLLARYKNTMGKAILHTNERMNLPTRFIDLLAKRMSITGMIVYRKTWQGRNLFLFQQNPFNPLENCARAPIEENICAIRHPTSAGNGGSEVQQRGDYEWDFLANIDAVLRLYSSENHHPPPLQSPSPPTSSPLTRPSSRPSAPIARNPRMKLESATESNAAGLPGMKSPLPKPNSRVTVSTKVKRAVGDESSDKMKKPPFNRFSEIVSAGGSTVWESLADVGSVVGGEAFDVVLDNNGKDLDASRPVIDWAKSAGAKQFLFISNAGIYKPTDEPPHVEGDAVKADAGHVGVEKYIEETLDNWAVFRPEYMLGSGKCN
ncbi:unnamed protein product [Vicia faba]|uniref:Uncharacterized protein n=1 Tax=Vicia faba TaxID=3906 RepID=A0AAV0YTN2_VICFA|nr:unnamed protein product [Vicia faba]